MAILLVCVGTAAGEPEGAINQFSIPTNESSPGALASGPDGNLWFTEYDGERIGRIAPAGTISDFAIPTAKARPEGIAPGPDGDMWFTERQGDKLGMITPSGAITEFPIPAAESEPEDIALGPDGNLWFTEYRATGSDASRRTGSITEFPLPTAESGPLRDRGGPGRQCVVHRVPQEPDRADHAKRRGHRVSDTERRKRAVAHRLGSGRQPVVHRVQWQQDRPHHAKRHLHGIPDTDRGRSADDIAAGPEGNLWFSEYHGDKLGRITPSGTITEFPLPTAASGPSGLAAGPDGNMWFGAANTNSIGRIGTGAPEATVSAPVLTGGGLEGSSQACSTSWSTWDGLQPSATLFGFDGYRWLLDGGQIATGQSYTPTREQVGHQLSCSETATYPLLDVTDSVSSAAVTVLAPPPPAITDVRESASRWREGNKLAHASRRPSTPPVGTTISFVLSERASVGLVFVSTGVGRRRSRTSTVAKLSFSAHSGANKVSFQGRISRTRKLRPGDYKLIITAINAEGAHSAPESLSFTIAASR